MGPSASVSIPAPVLVGLMSVASTVTREDVVQFQGMYDILDNIRITAPSPDDMVTLRPKGGIALHEGFLHVGLCLLLHSFIVNFLDHYRLVPAQLTLISIRIVYSFIVLCHFHKIMARFSLFRDIFILKCHSTKEGW